MKKKTFWTLTLILLAFCLVINFPASESVYSQGRGAVTPEVIARRKAIESELQSIAIVERKMMIPMRDGVRIATDVYRQRNIRRSSYARRTTSITGTSATARHATCRANSRQSNAVTPMSR